MGFKRFDADFASKFFRAGWQQKVKTQKAVQTSGRLTSRSSRPRYARRLNSSVMGGIQKIVSHGRVSQSESSLYTVPLQVSV